jgi:intracellular septation protein
MKALIEFLPLVAFAVAYYLRDVYFATATLMVAMPLMLLGLWLLTRTVSRMQLLSTVLVLGFGALTLSLHDPRFIQWKPTLFLWSVAIVFAVSAFISRPPLVAKLLAGLAEGRLVSVRDWQVLNAWWIGTYLALGALNLVVARSAPEPVWVNFKVFGLTGLLLVFLVSQALWLQRRPPAPGAAA